MMSKDLLPWLVCAVAATGTCFSGESGITTLKKLDLAAGGRIISIEREDSPNWTNATGRTYTGVPPRTLIDIELHPVKKSSIRMELSLPDVNGWNSRFLGLGNGGPAGTINRLPRLGPCGEGYAVATTDMGTAPDPSSGIGNPEVWKDFGHRATHLMTTVAKQAIYAFYGRGPSFSYFNGGSTGGQQSYSEVQRYPEDYDGVIAMVPAHCRAPLHAYFLWNQILISRCPFSDSQERNVVEAGDQYLASRQIPPLAGKAIADPRCDRQDIEGIIALAIKKDPSLTSAHADTLRKLFDGPRDPRSGERIFGGIPAGSYFKFAQGRLYPFQWVFGASKTFMDFDFGKDMDVYSAALGPHVNAEEPNLRAFEARGGKLLAFSGSADAAIPSHASIDYYERVVEVMGSLEKTRAFFRYYVVPGMAHGTGDNPRSTGINSLPNLLPMIIDWREKGAVPEAIPGKRVVKGRCEFEVPVYPYPTMTGWDAATGTCKPVEGPRGGIERITTRFRPSQE